ncbi:MAG: betaine/proline/choline family ABC transporter ATP-binding protein [Maritimibacter sp.]|nr:betaine/proline/choline family ABC transporter ATP-binding protein [Maritimibacter sp.]
MADKTAFLRCENVWKVFGDGEDTFLQFPGPDADAATFARHGLIAGVRNANLDIAEGEIFVIMGLSGSGKSTLVRCMTGLHKLSAGRVYLDGVDIAHAQPREIVEIRRKKISMVFQDFALLPHLTVIGNVAFPLKVQGVARKDREARAREIIELVGLKGREDYYPDELSGGQQQRVGIARSLTTDPQVWFLDEPFSALDPLIRQDMQSEFLRLQNKLQKTIVFITHDFDEAVRLADRIAVMKDGEVVQLGTPEEFILNPANDYIREFTRNIPQTKVLRIRSVMKPVGAPTLGAPIRGDARLSEAAEAVLVSDGAHPVVDAGGRIIGTVHRTDIAPYLV